MSNDAQARTHADMRVVFSFGSNTFDAHPAQQTVKSFAEFASFICEHRSKKKGELYFCAPFARNGDGQHRRCKDSVQPRRFLSLDLDYIENQETLADLLLALQRWRHFSYSTASHTDKSRDYAGY